MSTAISTLTANTTTRTWRDIPQVGFTRPVSHESSRRRWAAGARSVLYVALALAAAVCVWALFQAWRENPVNLAAASRSAPLREVVLRTDGVLDRAWLDRALALKSGITLIEIDLPALQARLLTTSQVRTAVLARQFPDVLTVTLEERSPVVRMQAQDAAGAQMTLLAARDGIVYTGVNYDPAMIDGLPWLDGVRLVRDGAGFLPVQGLSAAADLLATARAAAPHLARDFQVISLARFARDGVILVRHPEAPEVIFGQRDTYHLQLARLDYILDEVRVRGAGYLRTVNLSIGGRQVPVAFETPEGAAVRAAQKEAEARAREEAAAARPSALRSPLFGPSAPGGATAIPNAPVRTQVLTFRI
jgi:hypothetical protein